VQLEQLRSVVAVFATDWNWPAWQTVRGEHCGSVTGTVSWLNTVDSNCAA